MVTEDTSAVRERIERLGGEKKKRKRQTKAEVEAEAVADAENGEAETPVDTRPVSKEQMKNKGLQPYRKTTTKTPRVKNRMKYKKAVGRQLSQVPRARTDAGNYEGEKGGIKTTVVRAVKYK